MIYSKNFYRTRHQDTKYAAHKILSILKNILPLRSIVDFGCGTGTWLLAAENLGFKELEGYEGNWLNKSMYKCNKATLTTHNLEDKINTIKRYDIALSLEVAEHLSAKRAHSFVEELCNIANIVLFSAAIPGQGGTHHINEQWQSYWVKKFNENNFSAYDVVRPKIWNDPKISFWYKQNILLFINNDIVSDLELQKNIPFITDIIHPEQYLIKHDPCIIDRIKIVITLPYTLLRRIKFKISK